MKRSGLTRRRAMELAALATGAAAGGIRPALAQRAAPFTILIHQSPWFESFRQMVELYEKETGNKVELDINPYGGMIDKVRNSVRSRDGSYDILIMNPLFYQELFYGDFLTPFDKVEAGFKLDPKVITFGDTVYWNAAAKAHDAKTGSVLTMPVNGNMNLLFYRTDLYERAGLKVPKTWDEVLANARKLHSPPATYGFVERGSRGTSQISYNFAMYLHSFNASIFRDEKAGDFTVAINSPEAKRSLDFYLDLVKTAGHPNTGAIDQGQLIQQFLTGRAAHVLTVNAVYADAQDPKKSAVVGKFAVARVPHAEGGKPAPAAGHWMAGIAHNVPDARKAAALQFLKWFATYDNQVRYLDRGGIVVRQDVYDSDLGKKPQFAWFEAVAESTPFVRLAWTIPEGTQVQTVLDLRLNQAVIGELSPADALNKAADEIHEIVQKAGYRTGKLPPLR